MCKRNFSLYNHRIKKVNCNNNNFNFINYPNLMVVTNGTFNTFILLPEYYSGALNFYSFFKLTDDD